MDVPGTQYICSESPGPSPVSVCWSGSYSLYCIIIIIIIIIITAVLQLSGNMPLKLSFKTPGLYKNLVAPVVPAAPH